MDESQADINAKMILGKFEKRTRLLKAAHSRKVPFLNICLFYIALIFVALLNIRNPSIRIDTTFLIVLLIFLSLWIQAEAAIINKRIDALIELLEIDKMPKNPKEQ